MRPLRRSRKAVVQLTSLLDLLFVMIFVSLLQTKNVPPKEEPKPVPEVAKAEPKPQAPEAPKGKIAVSATFNFHATPRNPQLPSGSYAMEGTFNQETGFLQLGGVRWINQPAYYEMVPLKGNIDKDRTIFTGNIEFPDCKVFNLKRVNKASGSPIAGSWEGIYICSQGETGLRLELD